MRTDKHWKDIFSKIITEADILFELLDARNPIGTRNYVFEEFIEKNAPYKKIYLVINKIDLIPLSILNKWKKYLKKNLGICEPQIFTISARYNRGIGKFKKFIKTMIADPQATIMMVGYPNTGKSSLIAALTKDKNKKVGISSKAGFTRSLMKIKLTPSIYLIDSPGVIPLGESDEVDQVLKGIMVPEKLEDKENAVYQLMNIYIPPKMLLEYYNITEEFAKSVLSDEEFHKLTNKCLFSKIPNNDIDEQNSVSKVNEQNQRTKIAISLEKTTDTTASETLEYEVFNLLLYLIGKKKGILKQGGRVNVSQVCLNILHAWQKNKIKYYIFPPENYS